MRKRLERIAKKKAWRNNFYTFMQQALGTGFVALLSSYFLVPTLLSHLSVLTFSSHLPLSTLSSCLRSPTLLLACFFILVLLSHLPMPALFSPPIPALLFPLMFAVLSHSVLDPTLT